MDWQKQKGYTLKKEIKNNIFSLEIIRKQDKKIGGISAYQKRLAIAAK